MGKKSVKLVLTILLITGIMVFCFRSRVVSTGMQIKASGYWNERCSRPDDTQTEEADSMKMEDVKKAETSTIMNEKAVLKVNIQDDEKVEAKTTGNTEKLKKSDAREQQKEVSTEQKIEQQTEARMDQKTEQRTEAYRDQKTEQHTEVCAEQKTEQHTEARAEQKTEQHTEARAEQKTEQHTEVRVEQRTEQPAEPKVDQKTESPKCMHNWVWKTHTETVHHDDVYEEYLICEAYDENVYETHIFCNNCGLDLTVNYGGSYTSEAADHMLNVCGGCGYHSARAIVGTVYHDAEYGTKCTALAYDEEVEVKDYEYCSICGERK